eukprot:gene2006-biopygen1637
MDVSWFPQLAAPTVSLVPGGLSICVRDPITDKTTEKPLFSSRTTHSSNFEALETEIMKVIQYRYAPNTWVQRRSILKGYLIFCQKGGCPLTPDTISAYIMERRKTVTGRSAVQYMKALLSLMTGAEPRHITVLRALQRLSAAEPVKKANGITPVDMMRLIAMASDWQTRIVLRLAWMTASRWAEVAALTKECFRQLDDKVLRLDWGTHPKTSKEQPNRSFRFTMISERFSNRLRKLLRGLEPGQPLTALSGAQLRRMVSKVGTRPDNRGNPRAYSAHSIKHGALQAAAVLCDELNLDPRSVVLLAKHADMMAIPPSTIRYLQDYSVHLTHMDRITELLANMLVK